MASINFGLLNPNLPAETMAAPMQGYLGVKAIIDQENARKAAAEQQAFANNLAMKQFGLQEQTAEAQKGKARIENAKMLGDLRKVYAKQVLAAPSEATAMWALSAFGRDTGANIDGEVALVKSLGGDAQKIRQWAAGHALDADKMLPDYKDTGGALENTNSLVTAPPIKKTLTPGESQWMDPKYQEFQLKKATAGAMQVPAVLTTDQGMFSAPKSGGVARPFVDPATGKTLKAPSSDKLSSTGEKELFEASEARQKGLSVLSQFKELRRYNNDAYSGITGLKKAQLESELGGNKRANATIEYDRILNSISLESLRALFGGNPTEGERAAALMIQANTAKTIDQRETAINALVQSVSRQVQYLEAKERSITTGEYKTSGIANPNANSGGLSPEGQAALDKYLPKRK